MVYLAKEFKKELEKHIAESLRNNSDIFVELLYTNMNRYAVIIRGYSTSDVYVGRAHSMGSAKRLCESKGIPFVVNREDELDEDDLKYEEEDL